MVIARVHVDSIAGGGDGVARHDGMAVFVPRTAPGDVVDVSLEVRGRYARGAVRSIVEPAPDRTEPPCVHYVRDRCGGCQLQHMTYASQLRAKQTIVRDAIERIGRRELSPVRVHESPSPWRYRTKLTLALRWVGTGWIAGLHRYDAPDSVFSLEDCPITDERVVAIWREVLAASRHLPRARQLRGAVRLTEDGASFVLEGGREWRGARELAESVSRLTSIWWEPVGGRRRLLVDRRMSSAGGAPNAPKAPDASFAQINSAAAGLMHDYVVSLVLARNPVTVIDAYAGAGATAVALATHGVRVTAIELDSAAAHWVAARLPDGSRSIAGRVEESLAETLPADVVILNPPRAGVEERVTEVLERASMARAIVYVSCNPATLARDIGRLSSYRIASVQAFDMFPQTAHVETVCELIPEAA